MFAAYLVFRNERLAVVAVPAAAQIGVEVFQ
jgi:hypothetical protein